MGEIFLPTPPPPLMDILSYGKRGWGRIISPSSEKQEWRWGWCINTERSLVNGRVSLSPGPVLEEVIIGQAIGWCSWASGEEGCSFFRGFFYLVYNTIFCWNMLQTGLSQIRFFFFFVSEGFGYLNVMRFLYV